MDRITGKTPLRDAFQASKMSDVQMLRMAATGVRFELDFSEKRILGLRSARWREGLTSKVEISHKSKAPTMFVGPKKGSK